MYIINQEGVQAHYLKYINREKTLLNMKERESQEEVQLHVGRLQWRQGWLSPAGLYSISCSIGSPLWSFQFL